MLMSTVLTLLTATAATTTLTSNLALADIQKLVQEKFCVLCGGISHIFSFQQQPPIFSGPGPASGSPATVVYHDKKSSDSSSSTAKDPHKDTSSPPASRTNINNPDASVDTTTTKRNIVTTTGGLPPTAGTTQQMTITNGPFLPQQQQQHPKAPPVVTPQSPRIVTPHLVTLPLVGSITCKSTELLQNGNFTTAISQKGKCGPQQSQSQDCPFTSVLACRPHTSIHLSQVF